MLIVGVDRLRRAVTEEGTVLGRRCRAHPDDPVSTCPEWTGGDLLAHVCGFARWLPQVFDGTLTPADPPLPIEAPDALNSWGNHLRTLAGLLRRTEPGTPVAHWPGAPPAQAGFWIRRAAHEMLVHRTDADTLLADPGDAGPIDRDLAHDGVEEYFDAFVDTALATGAAPEIEATVVVELTDRRATIRRDLPHPGPVTTLRGTCEEMLLALWWRRDLVAHVVDGDRELIEGWPRI